MNKINPNESVLNLIENKSSKKVNEVFLKLLAKQKKPANPFDRGRSQTWNPSSEIKSGADKNDIL